LIAGDLNELIFYVLVTYAHNRCVDSDAWIWPLKKRFQPSDIDVLRDGVQKCNQELMPRGSLSMRYSSSSEEEDEVFADRRNRVSRCSLDDEFEDILTVLMRISELLRRVVVMLCGNRR